MAETARIVHRAEGERKHLWWDTEKHFPFMTMERGWHFCPYCGGFRFKEGEKYIFPTLPKNEKGEELPVINDIGCKNFTPPKKVELVKVPEEEKVQEAQLVEKAEKPPEEKPAETPKKRGIFRGRSK